MKNIIFFILISLFLVSNAQNPADVVQNFGSFSGFDNLVNSVVIQNDGKVILGGAFTSFNGLTENRIIRLNPDGTRDNSFNTGTGFDGGVNSIIIQNDEKILIGGSFISYNGINQNGIIRLNTDGTKDTSFNPGAEINNVSFIAIQADGKILVNGIRLNNDGSVDPTFNSISEFVSGSGVLAKQNDDKILFAKFISFNEYRIKRFNADGTIDSSFYSDGFFGGPIASIATQNDGKILVGGTFTSYNGSAQNRIMRLNIDGTKDTTFNIGSGAINAVFNIHVQNDGKIVLAGNFWSFNGVPTGRFVRLNIDGSIDTTLNSTTGFDGLKHYFAFQNDGKMIVGGDFTYYKGRRENRIIRLNADGSKDSSFKTETGFNDYIASIAFQNDGKMIVGGYFTGYKAPSENRIIRLNLDGTKDISFNTGIGFDGSNQSITVNSIVIQNDGKILVGGVFASYNGISENKIIRLNSDGTKDTSFNTGTGFNGCNNVNYGVNAISLQTDGKIIVGGNFFSYNETTQNGITRLNQDGTRDESFITGTGFNICSSVSSVIIQNDGKILVRGNFTSYNGVSVNNFIRLNVDGTLDTTFNNEAGFNNGIYAIALQNDNKILIAGSTIFNGFGDYKIKRLNVDGTVDNSFDTGNGFNNPVYAMSIQPDGKIIVGGDFSVYNGVSENYIMRLNIDGTKDTSFNTGIGFNNTIYGIFLKNDGKIFVEGGFTTYKNLNDSAYLIALNGDDILSNSDFTMSNTISLWPNPVKEILNINSLNEDIISAITIYDIQGKLIIESSNNSINVDSLSNGVYIVKISTNKGEYTKKFIKE